jgi:hypothetical protein
MTTKFTANSFNANEKLYINIDFEIKDRVKKLAGKQAIWDNDRKMWYLTKNLTQKVVAEILNICYKDRYFMTHKVTVNKYFLRVIKDDKDYKDFTSDDFNSLNCYYKKDEVIAMFPKELNVTPKPERKISQSVFGKKA